MNIVTSFIVPALVGIVVGILSGLLGIGGGTILVPVFRLAFGMSPVMSTATSLFTIIPTSLSGAVSHVRHRTCVPSLGVAAGLGGAVTSPFGVWLATISPGWLIMVVAALVIGWSAVKILGKAIKMKPVGKARAQAGTAQQGTKQTGTGSAEPGGAASAAAVAGAAVASAAAMAGTPDPAASQRAAAQAEASGEPPRFQKMTRRQLAVGAGIGLIAGVASGYVGVGGGFIMVPLMLSLVGIAMKQASGTSLIAVAILAIPGVVEQVLLGNVQYLAGIAVAIGSIPGAVVGARLLRVVPERQLRFLFGFFLIVAAAVLVLNEFGILG